jgi:hypothetical protein
MTASAAPARYRYQLKRFSRGKAMSWAPTSRGRKKLPRMAGTAGMTTRKIWMMPCRVNRAL